MPHILLAINCPPVQQPAGFLSLASSQTSIVAPWVEQMTSYPINFRQNTIQPHATRLALADRSGGANAFAVVGSSGSELALVAPGSGLLLTVRQGEALIGVRIQLSSDSTIACSFVGRNWIWLQQTGALLATNSLTPPITPSCLLGSAVSDGTNITSVDNSGVLYLRGGSLIRYSGDPGVPTDAPPSNLQFRQVTAFGDFEWNGAAYVQAGKPSVTADPTSVFEGMSWYRSDTLENRVYSGGSVRLYPVGSGGGSGVPASTVTDVGAANVVGTSTNFAREDHEHQGVGLIHFTSDASGDIVFAGAVTQSGNTFTFTGGSGGTPATTVTDVAAAGAAGTSTNYAREDHAHQGVHQVTGPGSAVSGNLTFSGAGVAQTGTSFVFAGPNTLATTSQPVGTSSASGSSTNVAREDHTHAGVLSVTGPSSTVQGALTFTGAGVTQVGAVLTFAGQTAVATTVTDVGGTAAVGTALTYAREDHTHKGVHKVTGSTDAFGDIILTGSGVSQSGNTFTISGTGAAATTVTDIAAAAVVGTSTSYARADHVHKGVHKITGTSDAFGDVVLTGAGVSQSGNTFTFSGSGGSAAIAVNALHIAPLNWVVPSALTEYAGLTTLRAKHDLTNATSARLIMVNSTGAGVPVSAPTIAAQYFAAGVWNYLDGSSGPACGYVAGIVDSGWITLASGAQHDVLLRLVGSGGDGATSIPLGTMYLQVK